MSVAVTINRKEITGRSIRVIGNLVFSNNYASGGDPLAASAFGAPTTKAPDTVAIRGKAGFTYEYDIAAAKVIVRAGVGAHTHTENTAGAYTQNATTGAVTATPSAGSTELAAGAYPAGVTGDVVAFEAIFPKFG